MSHQIVMPSGNSFSSFVINIIKLYEGKGVACMDARGRILEWIEVKDIELGGRVRDKLSLAQRDPKQARKLDWGFLEALTADKP